MHNCHIVAAEVRDRDGEEREGEILKGTPISGEKKKSPGDHSQRQENSIFTGK